MDIEHPGFNETVSPKSSTDEVPVYISHNPVPIIKEAAPVMVKETSQGGGYVYLVSVAVFLGLVLIYRRRFL